MRALKLGLFLFQSILRTTSLGGLFIAYLSIFLQTTLSNCNSCYFDAYIQLILLKKENAMKSEECLFGLRAGALLYGENNDLNMTNVNTTNELALYHIKRDPRCLKFFHKVPANLDELLAAMDAQVEPPFTEDDVLQEFAEKDFINMLAESIKEGADDATIAVAVSDQKLVGQKKSYKEGPCNLPSCCA